MDDYVRKEVFDAEIKRLESETARSCEKLTAEVRHNRVKNTRDIELLKRCSNEASAYAFA